MMIPATRRWLIPFLWGTASIIASAQPTPGISPSPMSDIYGHMGVGTLRPDISAALDITSFHAGLLLPRMTATQRNAIYQPATTLLIFNTTANQFEYNAGTPLIPNWVPFLSGININNVGWSLTGNSGTNPAINFVGTTDPQPLVFRTNNIERMRIAPNGSLGVGTPSPSPSAVADFSSSSQGVLLPRVTTTERDNIAGPATSLILFNTTTQQFEYNAGTPGAPNWVTFDGGISGTVPIPFEATTLMVNNPLVTAGANVVISISDPSGQTITASVTSITPGVGFLVTFGGFYPTATGSLKYVIDK
ncbi:MAG: hypothetical protein IPM61_03560 [Chlorobi bacterium]|nr:hypothetical protein [Chlorobiota bacterium]MBX7217959.1 hypothetical protein [Candidatus Kapabacteria bacterium]